MHGLRVSIAMKEISSVEKISSKPGMTIDVLGINAGEDRRISHLWCEALGGNNL